jgi:predicted NBD/HSP70 family sugar kinase/biotin operon repressor
MGRDGSLTASARGVLAEIARRGPQTRPRLGEVLNLSKPTVSAAIAELEAQGIIEHAATTRGHTGRTAAVYALAGRSGYVLGVDAGMSRVRVLAARLDGTEIAARDRARRAVAHDRIANMSRAAAPHVQAVISSLDDDHGPLRAVVVALPHTVLRPGADRLIPPDLDTQAAFGPLLASAGVPQRAVVLVENDVNCAALAERAGGAAAGRDDFVFLQVGSRIGAGIVSAGRLLTGANGAAGEVSMLPYPWMAGTRPLPEELERHLGSEGLMARACRAWPAGSPAPRDAAQLFELARRGVPDACRLVDAHAEDVGRLAAGISVLIDPGLIVLGGGVGSNPMLLPGVRRELEAVPWPTEVVGSELGRRANVLGAVSMALDAALADLLDGAA